MQQGQPVAVRGLFLITIALAILILPITTEYVRLSVSKPVFLSFLETEQFKTILFGLVIPTGQLPPVTGDGYSFSFTSMDMKFITATKLTGDIQNAIVLNFTNLQIYLDTNLQWTYGNASGEFEYPAYIMVNASIFINGTTPILPIGGPYWIGFNMITHDFIPTNFTNTVPIKLIPHLIENIQQFFIQGTKMSSTITELLNLLELQRTINLNGMTQPVTVDLHFGAPPVFSNDYFVLAFNGSVALQGQTCTLPGNLGPITPPSHDLLVELSTAGFQCFFNQIKQLNQLINFQQFLDSRISVSPILKTAISFRPNIGRSVEADVLASAAVAFQTPTITDYFTLSVNGSGRFAVGFTPAGNVSVDVSITIDDLKPSASSQVPLRYQNQLSDANGLAKTVQYINSLVNKLSFNLDILQPVWSFLSQNKIIDIQSTNFNVTHSIIAFLADKYKSSSTVLSDRSSSTNIHNQNAVNFAKGGSQQEAITKESFITN